MPDWLLGRPTIIGLAVIGGLLSLLAWWCQSRVALPEQRINWLNKAAYGFMLASIFLFIIAGLLGTEK